MKIPILTYHAMTIHGNDYANNNLTALAADLRVIHGAGLKIHPLRDIVRAYLAGDHIDGVAITCDDGSDFDFVRLPHPTAGPQPSIHSVLCDFHAEYPTAPPHATSFVIVSSDARNELDKSCMIGKGWWNDNWWGSAAKSNYMDIANHSWDHNHDALPARFHLGTQRGTFKSIDTKELADQQIRQASLELKEKAPNRGDRLFAYPYGETNAYLTEEYFPRFSAEIGIDAAFGGDAAYLTSDSERWDLPRFTCGRDWTTPEGLLKVVAGRY